MDWVFSKENFCLKKILLLIPFFVCFESISYADSNSVKGATPVPSQNRPKPFPTPNWNHLIRGKDYVPNVITVILKDGLSETEKKRILKKLSSIGKFKLFYFNKLKLEVFRLEITNGMSERDAINDLNSDPAVKNADLDATRGIQKPWEPGDKEGWPSRLKTKK